jgi:hypothetical protein
MMRAGRIIVLIIGLIIGGIKSWRTCTSVPEWPDVARFIADHFTFLHTFALFLGSCGFFGGERAGHRRSLPLLHS